MIDLEPGAAIRKAAERIERGTASPRSPLATVPAHHLPGQTKGAVTLGAVNAAPRPAGGQVAGLPGAQVAPPAGDLGDAIVASPAAARCAVRGC